MTYEEDDLEWTDPSGGEPLEHDEDQPFGAKPDQVEETE